MVCMYNILHTYMSTSQASPQPRTKQTPLAPAPPAGTLRTRYSARQLLGRFRQLLPAQDLPAWLALARQTFYERAFTPLITLWYCVFQRLSDNHHLSHVQEDALAGGADRLSPRGKPLSARLTSEATTSFSDARQRLPLQIFERTLRHTAAHLAAGLQTPTWFGRQVALLDGSTLRLRPNKDIPKAF